MHKLIFQENAATPGNCRFEVFLLLLISQHQCCDDYADLWSHNYIARK